MVAGAQHEVGLCPNCGSDRADVRAEHHVAYRGHDGDDDRYYRVLECRGCGLAYFKYVHTSSENLEPYDNPTTGETEWHEAETIQYWPVATRARPKWLDEISMHDAYLWRVMKEVYDAISLGLIVLSATGIRTAFDRASEVLGVDPALQFEEKLSGLEDLGMIGSIERENLEAVTEAGNAAAHRSWRPTQDQLTFLISTLEAFLHRAFILNQAGQDLRATVPPRPKRRAKTDPT